MIVTLLGTGSSTGTPQLLCTCPVCTSKDPRNKRTRFSILVEVDGVTILVDAPFELRQQLLAAQVKRIDAVWLTHAHSDHLSGIDDLRIFSFARDGHIPFYALPSELEHVRRRFSYLFEENEYFEKHFLDPFPITDRPIDIAGIPLRPVFHTHGKADVASFRLRNFAFIADFSNIEPEEVDKLHGLDMLVVSATVQKEHYKHMKLTDVVALIRKIAPRRAILTHMNHHNDYEKTLMLLPAGIEPGYDGMRLEI